MQKKKDEEKERLCWTISRKVLQMIMKDVFLGWTVDIHDVYLQTEFSSVKIVIQ